MSQKKVTSIIVAVILALAANYFSDGKLATVTQNEKTNTSEFASASSATKLPEQDSNFLVTSVVDGDTIKVMIDNEKKTIRVIGINTPETVDPRRPVECFGKEASDKAKELLTGKTVTLKVDPSQQDTDKYGRLLRYVFLSDGTDFGKSMIANGYAYEYTYNIPYNNQKSYKEAQQVAQLAEKGLWSKAACNN